MKKQVLTYNMFKESQEYTDQILDKISQHGLDSLTSKEKEFLDSHKDGKEDETFKKIKNEFSDILWRESGDDIKIKFIYEDTDKEDGFLTHYGKLVLEDDKTYEFDGSITEFDGTFITDFENDSINDWMIMEGMEYEYEQFIEYIFGELSDNYKLRL
jgi:hypothetical protein